ncbi:MAG: Smr/MutS family protein [Acidobacteriia bacterium]|nr:Smr/MutS family protein [Terriglobia bacterium]
MSPAAPQLPVLNLKFDMPTIEQARRRLLEFISSPRQKGPLVKIVHGYGSTGRGGALRTALRELLQQWEKEDKIKLVIFGENWSIFDARTQDLRQRYPWLQDDSDSDLDRHNQGITIVEFHRDTSRIFK